MTLSEITQVRALFRCRFGHREFDKRFVRDLNRQSRVAPDLRLSNRQRHALASILYRYRRQLERLLPPELRVEEKPDPAAFGLHGQEQTVPDLFGGPDAPPHEPADHG